MKGNVNVRNVYMVIPCILAVLAFSQCRTIIVCYHESGLHLRHFSVYIMYHFLPLYQGIFQKSMV